MVSRSRTGGKPKSFGAQDAGGDMEGAEASRRRNRRVRAGRLDIKGVPLPLPFLWAHHRHTAVACCISQGLCAEASVPGSSSALLFEDNQASEPRGLASCLVSLVSANTSGQY